jgi:hypothetical protein
MGLEQAETLPAKSVAVARTTVVVSLPTERVKLKAPPVAGPEATTLPVQVASV